MHNAYPLRIVNAIAPIRICDNGGWTDTWFAEHGKVFNIGVLPGIEVQVEVFPAAYLPAPIIVHAENYGAPYAMQQEQANKPQHPLLEAAIALMDLPGDCSLRITIYSQVPAGAGTGTSAAVAVALIGALDLLAPGRLTPHEVAYKAWSVETEVLGRQSGIQDQLCAAYGGINYVEMFRYPSATVSQIHVSKTVWWELEQRLQLIYLGKSHDSSAVHEKVIGQLEQAGANSPQLNALRATAGLSRDALYAGDFHALGQAMVTNTDAQRGLHPELVGADAQRVIEIARAHDALGWKVNGAGGSGGSVTILCDARSSVRRTIVREIEAENTRYRHIPITLSHHGLRRWQREQDAR